MADPLFLTDTIDEALDRVARAAFRAGFEATTKAFNGELLPDAEHNGELQDAEDAALARIIGQRLRRWQDRQPRSIRSDRSSLRPVWPPTARASSA